LYLREVENLRAERETLMAENMIVENDFQEYRDKVIIHVEKDGGGIKTLNEEKEATNLR
jgi:hypothetical protein